MARVRLDLSGFAAIEHEAEQITDRLTRAVERDAIRRCPVDTGELVESIHSRTIGTEGRVYVGTEHWGPTEFGSRPHKIRSTGPWPLRNSETGAVFGREVDHPGTPEQAFMRPALYQRRAIR